MKKYLGILGLLTVTVIWGGGFVASDMALETLTPFQIMAVRFLIAAVIMTSDYRTSIYNAFKKCFSDGDKCCHCAVHCTCYIPEKDRGAQPYRCGDGCCGSGSAFS